MTLLMILIGLSIGVVEGTGLASFITLLDIIPRLAQITKSRKYVRIYETVISIAVAFVIIGRATYIDLGLSKYLMIPISFVFGTFIGLLASALAETLDVIPVLERKVKLGKFLIATIFALAIGKVVGSFFYWFILMEV